MSVEGGAFRCDIHLDRNGKGFTTTKLDEWNDHCSTTEGHREMGYITCSGCGDEFTFSIPFRPLASDGSKGIGDMKIMCNQCKPDQDKDIEVIKIGAPKK